MSHRDVQDFHYGDIYDYENTKSLKYINTNFTLQNISSGLESDTKTINGVLFCVDRLTDNGDNKLIAQSRCTDILQSIIIRLAENYSGWSIENTVYEVFSTKFADLCAGCFCTFSLSVDEDIVCSDDEFIVKSKEIKANGIYDVIGYDRIIVDVQPKLKEIEIVKNGMYLPETDSDGYNKITVDVPPTPTQEKSVNITENGTQRIVPDSGYNLSGVDVNVKVPLKLINGTKLSKSKLSDFSYYDFSDITDMDYMFYGCSNLMSVPTLYTSNTTSMNKMFHSCEKLITIPTMDTSKVKSMNMMFTYCSNLTSVPALNTSNVTDMNMMFADCLNITSIPALYTSNVTDMDWMFQGCEKLTSIPLLDASKETESLYGTFMWCYALTDLGGFTNLGKAFSRSKDVNLSDSDKLTNQSVQNLIDTVYDMNLNTQGGKATLRLKQTVIDAMSDTQKSQLAAKGWTLTN